ncbi:MAG: MBL fold metallo-hydrolase [Lachnospiraceae bacterium]|nr:MBL fold metallo-hydrolase [Lachnospiraceae bacterium]
MKIETFVLSIAMTNCYLAIHENTNECLLVDLPDHDPKLIDHIKNNHLKVKGILLTHGHFDHIMGVKTFLETFPVPVYAHLAEKDILSDPAKNLSLHYSNQSYSLKHITFLDDQQRFQLAGFDITAIPIPGHTPGGCCYYFAKEHILFSGDTLFHQSVGRTDFPGGDANLLRTSIQTKLLTLPENTKVFPGHMQPTTIKNETKSNPFL